jgi:hypothetical protein
MGSIPTIPLTGGDCDVTIRRLGPSVTGIDAMQLKTAFASLALAAAAFGPTMVTAAPAAHAAPVVAQHHKCTRTSTGTCIRGGEFCPKKDYGHHGWDAKGRRYTCKGNHTHPHWEK